MSVLIKKIKILINSQEFLAYLIGLILSTLLIGYATSSIILGLFVLFSIRFSIFNSKKLKVDFYLLIPILLYVLFVLTFFWSVNQDQTKTGLGRTVSMFVVPLAFSVIPNFSNKSYKIIFDIFTTSNVVIGLFFLINASLHFFKNGSSSVFTYHELVRVLDLNAIYVSLTFSISFFYLISKNKKTIKDIIFIVFFLILLLLLSSKMMIFILSVSVFVYVLINKAKNINKTITILILLALTISLSSIKLYQRILFEKDTNFNEVLTKTEFGQIYPWTGSSIRVLQLRILKKQIQEEAIFWKGFGLFASRDNVKKRHQEFDTYPGYHDYNYHNQYAQIFSETGVFGLFLLVMMLIVIYRKSIKNKNFLFLMFSFSCSFIFFTESLLWRQQGLFLFVILYSLILRTSFDSRKLNLI